jgi:hypothetical protein
VDFGYSLIILSYSDILKNVPHHIFHTASAFVTGNHHRLEEKKGDLNQPTNQPTNHPVKLFFVQTPRIYKFFVEKRIEISCITTVFSHPSLLFWGLRYQQYSKNIIKNFFKTLSPDA